MPEAFPGIFTALFGQSLPSPSAVTVPYELHAIYDSQRTGKLVRDHVARGETVILVRPQAYVCFSSWR